MDVTLRPVHESDLPVLYEHQLDAEATARAGSPARDGQAFLSHWQRLLRDPDVVVRAVETDGRLAGNIVSFIEAGERAVGYWLGREYWGRGIATRALELFLVEVTVRPLRAHVAAQNAASARVLEKCGFHLAGEAAADFTGDGEMVVEQVYVLE
jgi:RimJ/RimL family protein N-acetyltransferase